nr:PREDICTED: mutS protein homolog 4-like [Megachile rotundata]
MNVMQNDLFRPAKERNEARLQRELDLPPILSRHYLDFNFGRKQQTNWRPASPNCSKSSNYQNRNIRIFYAYVTCTRRSGTKTNTGPGSSTLDSGSGIVLAITTGRGEARFEVGIAALNVRCPHLILCQISDSQTYTNALRKLYLFDPIEILMPDTMCERAVGKGILYRSVMEKFPELEVIPISRVHFNDAVGLERVKSLCIAEYSSVELYVKQKYYALAAAAALLKYVEYTRRVVYVPKSMKIEFQGSPNSTTIDLESARSLELVESQCGQRNMSLLGVLDRCSTPMGRKLLRTNILQPPCEERIILRRQAAVAEIASDSSLRALVQSIVRRLYGADRLLALATTPLIQDNSVQCAEQNLNYVLLLKNLLDVVPELASVLSAVECDLLRTIRKVDLLFIYVNLNAQWRILHSDFQKLDNPEFQSIRERILETIHPDARSVTGYTSSNMQRCFAIKAGINDLLDIARQTYCELIDDMKTMVENLSAKYQLILSLNCNASLGYHVQVILPKNVNPDTFEPPAEFIEVRKNKRSCTMTTTVLATLSQQCKIACEELHLMSNVLLCDLLQSIRGHIGCLFQLSADVAELDLVTSLAQVSTLQMYARPTFGPRLDLVESRHPVMEVFGVDAPTPNDIVNPFFFSTASVPYNFSIISGPNMSGKSTYLKQIVLLHIMAQIGCFVPAKNAMFRITDFVFCKIAVRDDIECNASTFTLEMKEAQYILRSVTPTSLVVLDELCKGTAIEEGTSIAWAICEQLLNTTAFVFAATHFSYLTKLPDLYRNATRYTLSYSNLMKLLSSGIFCSYHFEAIKVQDADEEIECRLTYTHRLKLGVTPSDDYGIVLAELTGLPKPITEKARKYASEKLTVDRATTESNSWEKTCYDLVAQLYELLETNKFDRERITLLVKRFNEKIPRVEQTLGNKKDAVGVEADVHRKKENLSRKPISETAYSKQNFDARNRCTQETTRANPDFRTVSPSSSTSGISMNAVPLEIGNRGNSSISIRGKCMPLDRTFSTNTSSFYSAMDNRLRLNELEKRPSVSSKITFGSMDRSETTRSDLSLSSMNRMLPMQTSMDSSLSKLYDYCLSDNDFEPCNVSQITSLMSDTLSTDALIDSNEQT